MPPITVECINEYYPPMIRITILGQQGFDVSQGSYDYLKGPLGLPDSPCDITN